MEGIVYLGEAVGISRNWDATHFLAFGWPWNSHGMGVLFSGKKSASCSVISKFLMTHGL